MLAETWSPFWTLGDGDGGVQGIWKDHTFLVKHYLQQNENATFIDGKAWETSQSVLVILFLEACYGINKFHFFCLKPSYSHLKMTDDERIAEDDDGVGQAGAQKSEEDSNTLAT